MKMQVVNVANKASPGFVASYITGDVAVMVAHRDGIAIVGYLEGMLDILDVSKPATALRSSRMLPSSRTVSAACFPSTSRIQNRRCPSMCSSSADPRSR